MTPAPVGSEPCDVFLCHHSADKPAVLEIAARLRAADPGLRPWVDQERMRGGDLYVHVLGKAIARAPVVACFFGASGVGDTQTEEIALALARAAKGECRVCAVYLPSCPSTFVPPPFLQIRHWVDFRRPQPDPLAELYRAITGHRLPPPSAAASPATPAAPPADDGEAMAAWLRHGRRVHARMPVLGPRSGARWQRSVPRRALELREEPWPVVAVEDLFVELTMQAGTGRRPAHDDADRDLALAPIRVSLDQALARIAPRGPVRMALLGEPGAGKTTLLRHLFGRLAPPPLPTPGAAPPRSDPPPPALAGLRPVWLSCRAIAEIAIPGPSASPPPTSATLADVVRRVHRDHAAAANAALAEGTILFLLDGLDEIGDAQVRLATCNWLLDEVDRWERAAFLVTCRRSQWKETPGLVMKFAPVSVEGLTPALQGHFVRRWFRVAGQLPDADADRAADGLLRELQLPAWTQNPRLAEMVANPLMLATLCALRRGDKPLPARRHELYDQALELLIETWPKQREEVARWPWTYQAVRPALEPLAYECQAQDGRVVPVERATAIVAEALAPAPPDDLLDDLRDHAGVLSSDDPGTVEFVHPQFRELLAAGCVGRRGLGGELALRLTQTHWQETMLLAMQLPGVSGPFLDAALAGGALATSPGVRHACVVEAGAMLDPRPIERAIDGALGRLRGTGREEAKAALEALFELVRGLELAGMVERQRAFEQAVGRTPAHEGWDWTPGAPMVLPVTNMSFQWIPPGRFTMGSASDDREAFANEKPAHEVTITRGYWMGEHPVTNAQYRAFVATGHPAPLFWGDRRFNDPAQPVVGVSWDDAQAFCAWVNASVPPATGLRFRLPTEAEWEYAARGTDGRRYPWGNEPPDGTRATFDLDENTGGPSAVGQHPAGVSPFGLHDLSGNVWEWCEGAAKSSRAPERYAIEPAIDPAAAGEGSSRVYRGGSWRTSARYVRAALRFACWPVLCSDSLGFRLAGGPSAPSHPAR